MTGDDRRDDPTSWGAATRAVRGGLARSGFDETAEGLFLTSGYVYGSPEEAEATFRGDIRRHQYSRFANPTVDMFAARLALLEGADYCCATATGMAAATLALLACTRAGDRVVGARALFGSCLYLLTDFLPRYGVATELVDGTDPAQWKRALSRPTAAVLLESPSNPGLEIVDIQRVADLTHAAGGRLIVDNAFASPVLQRPLDLGADVVFHSSTKYVDGQGRTLGGAVLTRDAALHDDHLLPLYRNTGPAISPFNAWVQLKGLETLDLRMRRHCANALRVARFLESRPEIARVLHPDLESHPQHALARAQMRAGGGVVAFETAGGKAAAFELLNGLRLIDISNNLGDAKSLITHPATTTHHRLTDEERARVGITGGLLRLSVGLEDPEDVVGDLAGALGG